MSISTLPNAVMPTDLALPEPTQYASRPTGPARRSGIPSISSMMGRAPAPPAAEGGTPPELRRSARRVGELPEPPPPAATPTSAPSRPSPASGPQVEGEGKGQGSGTVAKEKPTTAPPEAGEKPKKTLDEVAEEGQEHEKEVSKKGIDATFQASMMNIQRNNAERTGLRWKNTQETLNKLV